MGYTVASNNNYIIIICSIFVRFRKRAECRQKTGTDWRIIELSYVSYAGREAKGEAERQWMLHNAHKRDRFYDTF